MCTQTRENAVRELKATVLHLQNTNDTLQNQTAAAAAALRKVEDEKVACASIAALEKKRVYAELTTAREAVHTVQALKKALNNESADMNDIVDDVAAIQQLRSYIDGNTEGDYLNVQTVEILKGLAKKFGFNNADDEEGEN